MKQRIRLFFISLLIPAISCPSVMAQRQTAPAESVGPKETPLAEQPSQVRGDEINEAQKQAVQRGLAWLAAHQTRDGNFGSNGYGAQAAVTALAGLAFMSAGNLPGRGEYGDNVRKCVDFILKSSNESGLLSADNAHGVMYAHGFAALFLAEVYGMTGDEEVKEKLQKAVRLIQKSQNPEGGWRYTPAPLDADISVTICQVMALRAARDAGIKVEKQVIDNAIEYVRRCHNPDGGFSYTATSGGGGSAFPRSAAGVAALYYAGIFQGNELIRGLDYLKQFTPGNQAQNQRGGGDGYYFYGHYYAVQAMFLAGGDYWAQWYPAIRDELIQRQDKRSGAWQDGVGEDYGTACALIILQMPNRYLPVFNGKGPGN